MNETIEGILILTGGIVMILAFAWLVGYVASKFGIEK